MKKLLLTTTLLIFTTFSVSAGMLGLDWETTGEYNVDTDVSSLTMEVGKSVNLSGLTLSADADFDIIGTSFSGTDYKASMNMHGESGMELYVKTGLDKTWKREDIVAGFTFSW